MLDFKEIVKHNLKNVRVRCIDGYTREGKCYAYSELDDNDEIEVYLEINSVHITAADIASIEEI